MRPLPLTFPKIKINKRILSLGIIVGLFLVLIAGYFLLQKAGKFPEFNAGLFLSQLVSRFTIQESQPESEEEKAVEELKITLPTEIKSYKQTAQPGEGITHLARRALKEYLIERKVDFELTPEHKIYIEDYLQKKTGERWLNPGEEISFSEDLIKEAINKAQQLTPEQLDNLKQFSTLVSSL